MMRLLSVIVFICCLLFVINAFAQGTPSDQYKQMGGVAALAELAYNSKAIPEKLNAVIKTTVTTNPKLKSVMEELVKAYNEGYSKAATNMTLWNGTLQEYSKKPYNVKSKDDIAMIKKFEKLMLDNLK